MSALALRAPLGEPQFSASLAQPVTRWSHIWKLGGNFHQLWDSLCSDRTHTHNLSSHTHSVTTLWFLHHVLIAVRELKAHQPACTIFPCFSVCLYILSLSVYLKKYLFLSYVHLCFDHGSQVPGTGITDSCELPCGCGYWELNPGPLEEQSVFNQETISAARHGASLYIVLPGKHDLQSSQSSLCPLSKGVVLSFNV